MKSHLSSLYSKIAGVWFILPVVFILVFLSCEKEIDYPAFAKVQCSALTNSSYLATAQVKSKGEFGINDHGFVYIITEYNVDQNYFSGTQVSLGKVIQGDTFATVIQPNLSQIGYYNLPKIYIRAYITDERGTVYSNIISLPISVMKASYIQPAVAPVGDTISIYGSNFDVNIENNTVTFNNAMGVVVSATQNVLQVIVPEDIPFDYYWDTEVTVKITSGTQVYQLNSFNVAPTAIGYAPKKGTWNTVISIYGTTLQNSSVFFDEYEAGIYSRTASQIDCIVPVSLTTKNPTIYLKSHNVLMEVPGGNFQMNDLVANVPRYNYYAGEAMYLKGAGYCPTYYANKVFIGPYTQTANCIDVNNIYFYIPSNLSLGSYWTKVTNGLDTVTLAQKINIVKPAISFVSISSGHAGTQVQISGMNLITADTRPTVTFGYYSIQPTSATSTKVIFNVPDLPQGSYSLGLYYSYFEIPANQDFTII